jgi:hypothetical protein
MDPFRICLALGPLAAYSLLLGVVNLLRRPLVISGAKDTAALGIAVSGFVILGPLELFTPAEASMRFGAFVWVLMIGLYMMCLVLLVLQMRPRLVIYNISIDELRPVLAELVPQLDPEARWAGDNLALPNLQVQLHVDAVPKMRNVSLVASGPNQNYLGWRRLELGLAYALREVEVPRNRRGVGFAVVGAILLIVLAVIVVRDPGAVAQAFVDMFRLSRPLN